MAYVYRHIRHDKNVPFYIGIGSDSDGQYKRANTNGNRGRNRHWQAIVAKTTYSIEIIVDEITWNEACEKEKEFIIIYGRSRDGGTLSNLTLGGEGQLGMYKELNGMYGKKASDETKKKQSLRKIGKSPSNKGKPMPDHVKEKLRGINTGKPSWNKGISTPKETVDKWRITRLKTGFKYGADHQNFGKVTPQHIRDAISKSRKGTPAWNKGIPMTEEHKAMLIGVNRGRTPWNKGLPMDEQVKAKMIASKTGKPSKTKGLKYDEERMKIHNKAAAQRQKPVYQYDLSGTLINVFECGEEASNKTGLKKGSLYAACRNMFGDRKTNLHGGYRWSYEKKEQAVTNATA